MLISTSRLTEVLRVALSQAPFRAFWKINRMVCSPGGAYTDLDVVACTRETPRRYGSPPPVAQPTREQLLTTLARHSPALNDHSQAVAVCARRESNESRHDHQQDTDRTAHRPAIVVKGIANPAYPVTGPGPFLLQSRV